MNEFLTQTLYSIRRLLILLLRWASYVSVILKLNRTPRTGDFLSIELSDGFSAVWYALSGVTHDT